MKILERLTQWGVGLYLFLLPWQTRWFIREGRLNDGAWEFGSVSIYATDILLLAIIVLQLFHAHSTKQRLTRFGWAGLALLLISIGSYYWAVDQLIALAAVLKFAGALALAWVVKQRGGSVAWLWRCFVAGALIQAGLGIYQVLTQQSWSFAWLGLAAHDPAQLGTVVIETDQLRVLRAYAGLPHPNILGGLLAIALLFLLGLYTDVYRRAWRVFEKKTDRERRVLAKLGLEIASYVAGIIVLSAGLLLTFSRSAWLAFLVGFGVVALAAWLHRDRLQLVVLAKMAVIIALVTSVTVSIQPSLWISRFDGSNRLEQHSINDRVTQGDQAGQIFEHYWLVGTGLGNYTAGLHELKPSLPAWEYQPVHFTPLLVAAEFGVLGLLVYLYFLFEAFRRTIVVVESRRSTEWQIVAAASLLALFVISVFDHYLWSLGFGMVLWWLVVGLLDREQ